MTRQQAKEAILPKLKPIKHPGLTMTDVIQGMANALAERQDQLIERELVNYLTTIGPPEPARIEMLDQMTENADIMRLQKTIFGAVLNSPLGRILSVIGE